MKKFHLVLSIAGIALLLGVMITVVHVGGELQFANQQHRESIIHWIQLKDHTVHNLRDYLDTGNPKAYDHFRQDYRLLKRGAELSHSILDSSVPVDSVAGKLVALQDLTPESARNQIYYARKFLYFRPIRKSVQAWYSLADHLHALEDLGRRIDDYVQDSDRSKERYRTLDQQLKTFTSASKRFEATLMKGMDETTAWLKEFIRNVTWGLSILLFIGGSLLLLYIYRQSSYHEQKYRQLFANSEMAIVYLDNQSRVIEVNKAFTNLFGYTAEETVGKNLDELLAPPSKQDEALKITRKTLSGESITETTWRTDKQGERIDLIIGALPVKIEGRLQGIFGIYYNISQLVQTQQKLKQSLEEKQLLIQEIHHRVKNNLAVIASLLQLQIDSTRETAVQSILRDSHSRIYSMAMIHELLYQSENFSKISIQRYIEQLINHWRDTHIDQAENQKQIDLDFRSDDLDLNINQAIPCGLIINELISNALEHVSDTTQTGWIRVNLSKSEDDIVINVRDNGCGTGPLDRDGAIGLNIVQNLVYQLEGELNFNEYPEDNIAEVEIRFKQEELKGSASTLHLKPGDITS